MMVEACGMAEFTGRDLHLVKKALAIAVLAIERQPGAVSIGVRSS
jgi:hypothetical protein